MIDFKELTVCSNISIRDAMRTIEKGAVKMVMVIDKENYLKGILTDGDIRRAILGDCILSETIESIYNQNPIVAYTSDSNDTIIRKSLQAYTNILPLVDSKNILIGIKDLKNLFVTSATKETKVVIMAGGLGSRLRPLTEKIPKPLLDVGGKPMLETIIESFCKYGFYNFIISVNYKSEMIRSYFGDGEAFGVTITYIEEIERMGTAGSLALMTEMLHEPFFLINADLLTNLNFHYMLQYHIGHGADVTMATRAYKMNVPYGVIHTVNQEVLDIEEKPTESFLVSGGIYILNPNIIKIIPKNTFYDVPELFDKILSEKRRIVTFSIRDRDYWKDIGTLEDYEQANKDYEKYFK
jgi:dTDP-glucose pyrophosphorylase